MKEQLFRAIDNKKETLWEMADFIFDHPEYDGKEYRIPGGLRKRNWRPVYWYSL